MILLGVSLPRDLRTNPMIVADRAIEHRLRREHRTARDGSPGTRASVPSAGD